MKTETNMTKPAPCNTLDTQRTLNRFYLRELGAAEMFTQTPRLDEYTTIHAIESGWNAYEEARLAPDIDDLPRTPEAFRAWYMRLHRRHRLDVAGFFEHLSETASAAEIALYIGLEEQVDGRFDDVIALAQLGLSGDMKLALAENFWDEMGLGKLEDMHTVMFERSTAYARALLARNGIDVGRAIPPEALKNGNLLLMYALRRQHGPRLLGALTILEHTAPYRFARTVRALRRVGAPETAIAYHELHVTVDANHGKQLIERVLTPMVQRGPEVLREICIGCLIRYRVAVDYYRAITRMFAQFGLDASGKRAA
jgi:hypothetical protein